MADAHGGQPEPAPGQRVIVLGFDEATWEKTLKFFHENARQANDYLQIIHVVGLRDTPQSSLTSHEPVLTKVLDHSGPALISHKQLPNPANEPGADFLFQKVEPLLKSLGYASYRISVLRFDDSPGEVGRVLVANAHLLDARLILTSTRSRTGLAELVSGSTSNHVLHHAHCSVLVVR